MAHFSPVFDGVICVRILMCEIMNNSRCTGSPLRFETTRHLLSYSLGKAQSSFKYHDCDSKFKFGQVIGSLFSLG